MKKVTTLQLQEKIEEQKKLINDMKERIKNQRSNLRNIIRKYDKCKFQLKNKSNLNLIITSKI